jgi:hypothetical protein
MFSQQVLGFVQRGTAMIGLVPLGAAFFLYVQVLCIRCIVPMRADDRARAFVS